MPVQIRFTMKSTRSNSNRDDGYAHSISSGFTRFVYAVFILNVLAVVLLLAGLLAGWFGIDGDRMSDGTYRLGLVFDTDEVGDDIGKTMNAASNLTETAKSATSLETYDGKIKSIDVATERVVLTSESKDYNVQFTDATEFDSDRWTSVASLKVGEPVRLTVQSKNDQLFAVKVKEVATAVPE